MRLILVITILFSTLLFTTHDAAAEYDIRNSIVKIYTQKISPYYSDPWTMNSPEFNTGSGCIISNSYIITNAHVVADHTLIQIRKYGEAKRYIARALFIAHEVDLAILTVEDKSFFENTKPLEIGPLPHTQEEVLVYGFPKGGDTLSITKGVISRIEHERYAQSSLSFLAAQIDAPINPGNSGGPAIINDKVVGIVMQALIKSESIGYMVPTPIINHFLKDISDKVFDGFPSLGVFTQKIENPDLKRKYMMNENQSGVLVTRIVPDSPAEGNILNGDILLSIDGNKISGNGTVEFRRKERTQFSHFIQSKQLGEDINVKVLRHGKILTMNIELDRPVQNNQLVKIQHDKLPSYYIFGGLAFSPLTLNYLKDWGSQWYRKAPTDLLSILKSNIKTKKNEEPVVLIRVLASEINHGYHQYENWIITKVNNIEVVNLKHLIEVVDNSNEKFITFENSVGNQIVLDREKAVRENQKILDIYHIKNDRSRNLIN